ncbi:MAG: hypothetical protein WBN68_03480, partial [Sedimenticolaceae bacterium]
APAPAGAFLSVSGRGTQKKLFRLVRSGLVTDLPFSGLHLTDCSVLIPAGRRIGKPPVGELCPSAGAVLQFVATVRDLSTFKAS